MEQLCESCELYQQRIKDRERWRKCQKKRRSLEKAMRTCHRDTRRKKLLA